MTDEKVIPLKKTKKREQVEADHQERLSKTVGELNRLANEGKILVVAEYEDGKRKHVMNLDAVLKHYDDWGFSPGKKDKRGETYFMSFYIPEGVNILRHQDLYKMEFRAAETAEVTKLFDGEADDNV